MDIRTRRMARLYEQGMTLQQIGDEYGITRERVRQILTAGLGTNFVSVARKARERREAERSEKELAKRRKKARPCIVCGGPVLRHASGRYPTVTCSTECATEYRTNRYHYAPEIQEIAQARYIIAHPEGQPPSRVAWAKRVIERRK